MIYNRQFVFTVECEVASRRAGEYTQVGFWRLVKVFMVFPEMSKISQTECRTLFS